MATSLSQTEQARLDEQLRVKTSQEQILKLYDHFQNPKAPPLTVAELSQMTFSDFMSTFNLFSKNLQNAIGTGVNQDLKSEVQQQMIAEQQAQAKQTYAAGIDIVQQELLNYKQDLIRDIKSKKFPAYNGTTYNPVTMKKSPDPAGRAIGVAELAIAQSTPLKHVNSSMLTNFWQAGRIDLVSALIERAALNLQEFTGSVADDIKAFALKFYTSIGVQSSRQTLRYLNAFIKIAELYQSNAQAMAIGGKDFNNSVAMQGYLKVGMLEADFKKSIADDNLLDA